MSSMHKAAVLAAANGTRSSITIAAIVGISPRVARRLCRQLNVTLGNG